MSKNQKISLEEAQELYSKNEAVREFLEGKFSKEELTSTPEETLEEKFNRVWKKDILTLCASMRFLDNDGNTSLTPTTKIEVSDKDGSWVFEYNYSEEYKKFWFAYDRVWLVLEKKVSSDFKLIQPLIREWVEDTLNLKGVSPCIPGF
jgi:hypothetical protein